MQHLHEAQLRYIHWNGPGETQRTVAGSSIKSPNRRYSGYRNAGILSSSNTKEYDKLFNFYSINAELLKICVSLNNC